MVARGPAPAATRARTIAASAGLALLLGMTVYLTDRDWSTVQALAGLANLQPARLQIFGGSGGWLPALLHAYAFAVAIALLVPPRPARQRLAVAGWFAVAAGLELLQAEPVAAWCCRGGGALAGWPGVAALRDYAVLGHFATGDLLATAGGCLAALLAVETSGGRRWAR